MATISINGRIYPNIQLIAFDKDGTLVDFHHMWGERIRLWIDWLVQQAGKGENGRDKLYLDLCHTLGFNPQTKRIIHESHLAVDSLPEIFHITIAVLARHGLGQKESEQLLRDSASTGITAPPTAHEIQPIGDVRQTIDRLALAGIQIAIATSDDRATTEATIQILGIQDFVQILACGDDDIPNKPAPDALWHIGRQLNIQPTHMLMVGDSINDMIFGRNAGAAGCIGIPGGTENRAALVKEADVIINSIEEIEVIQ